MLLFLIGCDGKEDVGKKETLSKHESSAAVHHVEFMGASARAVEVVYVIDRSGSMIVAGTFDLLKLKLAESIAALDESQKFHLVFFAGREPIEAPAKKLVPATAENKLAAGEFLENIVAEGQTLVLPALERAFAVLKEGDPEAAKLVLMLSDGGFEGFVGLTNEYKGLTGSKAVLKWLDEHNEKIQARDQEGNRVTHRRVQIYTFLYRGDLPEDIEAFKQIAAEHGGKFTQVGKED